MSHLAWSVCWTYWFVRLFVLCGQGFSLLWTPALRPYSGPVRLLRERKGIGRCVRCVLATCGEGRLIRSEQLVWESCAKMGELIEVPFVGLTHGVMYLMGIVIGRICLQPRGVTSR